MAKKNKKLLPFVTVPPGSFERASTKCLEMYDLGTLNLPAEFLLNKIKPKFPEAQTARLATQFISYNRGILRDYGVTVDSKYDGQYVSLLFKSTNYIGAVPLLSPSSGRVDYGLVIKPRFEWSGLGPMLSMMGWKVVPTPIKLPLIPGTERKVPQWVLASITLNRIKLLLDNIHRDFDFSEADLLAPKGTVNWNTYVIKKLSSVKFLNIPCKFPDLKENNELKSAIHFTLRIILSSLQSQKTAGIFVAHLIEFCQVLLSRVNNTLPRQPSTLSMQYWNNLPIRTEVFREGLQAIEWTIEDRGLAGLFSLQGLPWIMPMELFFEAWIETIAAKIIRQIGGVLRTGRKRETITPISWEPSFLGSQKYLLPDVIIERENDIIILDAKYKRHWEELSFTRWNKIEDQIKENHREDLFQILAYSTLSDKKSITACLIYPCRNSTWQSMISRNRLFHTASVYAGNRRINIILAAVPMSTECSEAIDLLSKALLN